MAPAGCGARGIVEQEELLKPREAAKILSVSAATVYYMIHAGQIPCVRWKLPDRYDKDGELIKGKEVIRLRSNDVFGFIDANYNGQSGHKG